LKTALLATGQPGVIAFEGAYHGLGYGALNATHRSHFRGPFLRQLREFAQFVPFPTTAAELKTVSARIGELLRREKIGAILVEPVQARGGVNVPPLEFLPRLRTLCDRAGALLVLDEIYTGFGRTGRWFACEHSGVIPDLICLGKALTGGFPLSACVGRADVMDRAWPPSQGEAIHTSTYLGNPVGCAMALAQMAEIREKKLPQRSAALGRFLLEQLRSLPAGGAGISLRARGLGLLAGLELRLPDGGPATATALSLVKTLLHEGFILLPEGEAANVISFTPPLTISRAEILRLTRALQRALERGGGA
jgi:4-aminobutyrate aminotransferase-like enzyme